jgi:thymidylate synthase
MITFAGRTAQDAWNLAANDLNNGTHVRRSDSRLGTTLEIPQAAFVIEEPRQRWIASRYPPANIALAIAEVIWIISARSDARFLTNWSKSYGKYVSMQQTLHDAYGIRLRRHFGTDQLKQAAEALSANPSTRQVALQIWDAASDLPFEDGSPRDPNIPCNVLAMVVAKWAS